MHLGYEEIKEGRKVIAIKFVFKKTRITKRYNQHTGIAKNFYEKPKPQIKKQKSNADVLEGQLAFKDINKDAKPMKNVLSNLLSKLTGKE
ncbi:hypothetical protein OAP56_04085, partial [Rickettsiaceae bacterium]|nr:hypothetical protein [Rickettsiaceae bacterium]